MSPRNALWALRSYPMVMILLLWLHPLEWLKREMDSSLWAHTVHEKALSVTMSFFLSLSLFFSPSEHMVLGLFIVCVCVRVCFKRRVADGTDVLKLGQMCHICISLYGNMFSKPFSVCILLPLGVCMSTDWMLCIPCFHHDHWSILTRVTC